jgi:hypothetical protein
MGSSVLRLDTFHNADYGISIIRTSSLPLPLTNEYLEKERGATGTGAEAGVPAALQPKCPWCPSHKLG